MRIVDLQCDAQFLRRRGGAAGLETNQHPWYLMHKTAEFFV